jgi:hypothetical protein
VGRSAENRAETQELCTVSHQDADGEQPGARGGARLELSIVPKSPKNPYTVSVIDILHRPGEMREKSIDVVARAPS